ncbi:MAG: squalene synthase HpnC [Pseudomonadota bacterium]
MSINHYENFPVASILLPKRLRRPIMVIYRFARCADDIADEGDASDTERLRALAGYRSELEHIAAGASSEHQMFNELARVIREGDLPYAPFYDLLDAFAQDVVKKRYADYSELLDYCRRSANPVGRLLLHLFGGEIACAENFSYSDSICSALQLINFWQDIAIDWQKGRVYLPQSELRRFAVDEERIAAQHCDEHWFRLVDAQLERAEEMMRAGMPLVHVLPGRLAWEIRLTIQGGLRILAKIRARRGDVFRHRPMLSMTDYLRMGFNAAWM